jgi:hypothetical protein
VNNRVEAAALPDAAQTDRLPLSKKAVAAIAAANSWEQDRIASQVTTDRKMVWSDPVNAAVRTIFTPQGTLSAMDLHRPIVQEGLRISKRAFASIKTAADAQGTKLLVVFIPTKERVYCRYLKDSGARLSDSFLTICELEEQIKRDLIRSFENTRTAYLDVTAEMEAQTLKHVEIYPRDSDGHPQATGYGVIARTIYDAVRRQREEKR